MPLTLEQRIQRLEDRAALDELIGRYSIARDTRDLAGLIGFFTPDAEFHRAGAVVRGREEITAFFEKSMERYSTTLHTVHTRNYDWVSDDEVHGVVNGHAELALDGRLVVAATRYDDVYARHGGQWLIKIRSLRFMYASPIEELGTLWSNDQRIRWPGQPPQTADYPEKLPSWSSWMATDVSS